MKKLIAALLILAVAAGGMITYGLHSMLEKEPGEASQVSAQPASSQTDDSAPNQSKTNEETKKKTKPDVGVIKPFKTKADMLDAIGHGIQQNPDTIGWIYIPDTTINNSVVQSHDNTYYLRKTERKVPDVYGCYFADYTCNFGTRDELSANTVIYGHSDLKDNPEGPKFSQLFRFLDKDFAEQHPVINFSTVEEHMTWKIFAVYFTDTGHDYIQTELDGPSRAALAQQAKDRSMFEYDVVTGENDTYLTLSTCTIRYGTDNKDQRFVIMAKLVPEDEVPKTAAITVNSNPVQPNFG